MTCTTNAPSECTSAKRAQNCPKCGSETGNDWSQCDGVCPMPMSPHALTHPNPHTQEQAQ
jgi:hypothetical protein